MAQLFDRVVCYSVVLLTRAAIFSALITVIDPSFRIFTGFRAAVACFFLKRTQFPILIPRSIWRSWPISVGHTFGPPVALGFPYLYRLESFIPLAQSHWPPFSELFFIMAHLIG